MHPFPAARRSAVFEWTIVAHGLVAAAGSLLALLVGIVVGLLVTMLIVSLELGRLETDHATALFSRPGFGLFLHGIVFVAFALVAYRVGFRAHRRSAYHAIAIFFAAIGIEALASDENALLMELIPGSGIAPQSMRLLALAAVALLFLGLDRRKSAAPAVGLEPAPAALPPDRAEFVAYGNQEFHSFVAHRPLHALFENLRAGAPLAVFARPAPGRFHATIDQVALLALLGFAAQLFWEWLLVVDSPHYFDASGLAVHGFGLLLTLGFAWMIGREEPGSDATLRLLVMLLSTTPFVWLGYAMLERASYHVDWIAKGLDDLYWGTFFAYWLAPVSIRVLQTATRRARSHCIALGLLHAVAIHQALDSMPSAFVFFREEPEAPTAPAPPPLDAELVLHAQRARLARAVGELAPQRPGVTDLYVVSFGADARQAVFQKESTFVRELFDRKYATQDRSLLLVNHRDVLDSLPIASRTNLAEALSAIGALIDPKEDLVFVYLTGHGSRDHELYVRFPGLPLNPFGPDELDGMFEAAGIRSRLVIVSACYSGGFVDALADRDTLVMSSSARDRTSFGCSDTAELTHFARAYFDEALAKERDLVRAFELARARVEERETKRGLTPSLPQMAVGKRIAGRLDRYLSATATAL